MFITSLPLIRLTYFWVGSRLGVSHMRVDVRRIRPPPALAAWQAQRAEARLTEVLEDDGSTELCTAASDPAIAKGTPFRGTPFGIFGRRPHEAKRHMCTRSRTLSHAVPHVLV